MSSIDKVNVGGTIYDIKDSKIIDDTTASTTSTWSSSKINNSFSKVSAGSYYTMYNDGNERTFTSDVDILEYQITLDSDANIKIDYNAPIKVASSIINLCVYIDGVKYDNAYLVSQNQYINIKKSSLTSLTAGQHTIKLRLEKQSPTAQGSLLGYTHYGIAWLIFS